MGVAGIFRHLFQIWWWGGEQRIIGHPSMRVECVNKKDSQILFKATDIGHLYTLCVPPFQHILDVFKPEIIYISIISPFRLPLSNPIQLCPLPVAVAYFPLSIAPLKNMYLNNQMHCNSYMSLLR